MARLKIHKAMIFALDAEGGVIKMFHSHHQIQSLRYHLFNTRSQTHAGASVYFEHICSNLGYQRITPP